MTETLLSRVARWRIFRPKNPNLGKFWRDLQWKMYNLWPFGLLYSHLVYFTAIWCILWPFGIFAGYLVYFTPLWYAVPRKIWQPCQTVKQGCQIFHGA
jgi:hypothetical protein